MSFIKKVLEGDVRAGARLMRDLDDELPSAIDELRELYAHTGTAYVVGITGAPGTGKSTLTDALISHYRKAGKKVGVVAVDPTSPITGGAILGDRVRMQRHATDPGVFIRSLATRGHHGGLSRSTADVVAVLDAMGYERILLETVGVGQDEVEVVSQAHSVVVVSVPGLGDGIQAMKAGLLEVADVLLVNKADFDGADRTMHDLETMLSLRNASAPRPPVLKTVATSGEGVPQLVQALEQRWPDKTDLSGRAKERARARILDIVRERLERISDTVIQAPEGQRLVTDVSAREVDPYQAAEQVSAGVGDLLRSQGDDKL